MQLKYLKTGKNLGKIYPKFQSLETKIKPNEFKNTKTNWIHSIFFSSLVNSSESTLETIFIKCFEWCNHCSIYTDEHFFFVFWCVENWYFLTNLFCKTKSILLHILILCFVFPFFFEMSIELHHMRRGAYKLSNTHSQLRSKNTHRRVKTISKLHFQIQMINWKASMPSDHLYRTMLKPLYVIPFVILPAKGFKHTNKYKLRKEMSASRKVQYHKQTSQSTPFPSHLDFYRFVCINILSWERC